MKFKEGVDPKFLSAPAWYGLWIADRLHKSIAGREAICTSTGEGEHSVKRSRHYTGSYGRGFGNAFDLRQWHVDPADFAEKLRTNLGKDYIVIIEQTHIHCHWAPVYSPSN
jgi:hypothetical protein